MHTTYSVQGEGGITFHRVDGAGGWLPSKRGQQPTMKPIVSKSARRKVKVPSYQQARELTKDVPFAEEIAFFQRNRLISFQLQYLDQTTGQRKPARINWYHTTGTVGTALDHPRQ